MDDEILVSKEMLKAIGADSRIAILKALRQRQKTLEELAKELALSPPTVLEHITQLKKTGLISLIAQDKKRKWKYYALTSTGRKLIERKKVHIILLLVLSILLAFGALASLFSSFSLTETSDLVSSSTSEQLEANTPTVSAEHSKALEKDEAYNTTIAPLQNTTALEKEPEDKPPKTLELMVLAITILTAGFCAFQIFSKER